MRDESSSEQIQWKRLILQFLGSCSDLIRAWQLLPFKRPICPLWGERPLTSSGRLERAAEVGLVSGDRKKSHFSQSLQLTRKKEKKEKQACDGVFEGCRQHPVRWHLVCSYLCPAQVGGGTDLLLSWLPPLGNVWLAGFWYGRRPGK